MRSLRVSCGVRGAAHLVVVAEVVDLLVGLQVEVVQDLVDVLLLCPEQVPVVLAAIR